MARILPLLALVLLCGASVPATADDTGGAGSKRGIPVYKKIFFSQVYQVDQIYKSMKGPQSTTRVTLRRGPPELLWVTAYRTEIVGSENDDALPPDFMCHNNLNIDDMERHRSLFSSQKTGQPRIFTLSQGQMEVVFPKGFGLPIVSDEPLLVATQVLNHNDENADFAVRHKTEIQYVRDRDLRRPMKALFQHGVEGLVLVEGDTGHPNLPEGEDPHGEGCNLGTAAGGRGYQDAFGRVFNGHWVVAPGRDVNTTPLDEYLKIEKDSTVHYIAVHLHPFAESLELRDKTTGETVFRSEALNSPFQIGLQRVDHFSSMEGLPIYKDHEYELVSVYNNTSSTPQDSMAVMYLYHWDRDFQKPVLPAPGAQSGPVASTTEAPSGL